MMHIGDLILSFLRKKSKNPDQNTPEGLCPNCWGMQEYGGNFYKALKNEGINIDHPDERKGWIVDYAEKHLGDIVLTEEKEGIVCQKCKISYQKT